MELIPENIYVAIGQLVAFIMIIKGNVIFKAGLNAILKIKNGKNGSNKVVYSHNPNFQTLTKDIGELKEILIRLTTIVDERLPKKK